MSNIRPILGLSLLSSALLLAACAGNKTQATQDSATPATASGQEAPAAKGEVLGSPAPDSKFTQLRMGMSIKEVTRLIGQPSDRGNYITGKGFIPFGSMGSDTYRQELVYKGQGRLVFASNGGFSMSEHLIRITHNANEAGTR